MSVLLETSVGDLVLDLDLDGSPVLCRNFLKLVRARYYTQTLLHHIVPNRFAVLGDPTGTGHGGESFYSLLSSASQQEEQQQDKEKNRFLQSKGRRLTPEECCEKGRVVALELYGVENCVASQFVITTTQGNDRALDGYPPRDLAALGGSTHGNSKAQIASGFLSLGRVVEDEQNILDRWADCYADNDGRPYADWRIQRALVIFDPFENPRAMSHLLQQRGVILDEHDQERIVRSPSPTRPPEEKVEARIPVEQVQSNPNQDDEEGGALLMQQEQEFQQEIQRKQDKSRAVVLELLGDLPSADITAPENVLFIAKLNSVTTDEDLQLILSRFDENVQVDIVRDHDTGQSLNYAFAEFTTKQQATQAYLKMNQALIDDRRIVVDFSQSVAKLWDRHRQRYRRSGSGGHGQYSGDGASEVRRHHRDRHDDSRRRDDRHQRERHEDRHRRNRQDDRHQRDRHDDRRRRDRDDDRRRRDRDEDRHHRDRNYDRHHRHDHDDRRHQHRRSHQGSGPDSKRSRYH